MMKTYMIDNDIKQKLIKYILDRHTKSYIDNTLLLNCFEFNIQLTPYFSKLVHYVLDITLPKVLNTIIVDYIFIIKTTCYYDTSNKELYFKIDDYCNIYFTINYHRSNPWYIYLIPHYISSTVSDVSKQEIYELILQTLRTSSSIKIEDNNHTTKFNYYV